ncbi:asparagine synthase [Lentzea sp. NBRC 105346]|uniref:asparagine synthase-related protein n=1 Tax=Lentzea sp. NBRC 105346 TaxID=3032205 RepID=UPI0024A1B05B|nr:asparagine synthase-related protein [Lentzea sp. NBRC 105346]GLZ29267.1 asparagine synthase [Lentzea sp. NBRC 105346]
MKDGFVVLPDVDNARVVESLPFEATEIVRFPSGRPWLAGRWRADEFIQVSSGSVRVALIGWCPVGATRLAELAAKIRTPGDVDALARALPGSAHLIADVGGVVRVQGTITGLRGVFHANVDGLTVAADRADVLARLIGAGLDEDVLAVRLISVKLPPPLGERSVWRGVRAVPPDSYLTLQPARVTRWWRAPEPELSLAEGAPVVRAALRQATATPGGLSADMSGGLDSTSLCFLTGREDLVTARMFNGDPGNDDPEWAALAAAELPAADHVVIPRDDLPAMFGGLGTVVDTEAPVLNMRTAARNLRYAQLLATRDVRRHLAGHGGDQLFTAPLSYLHTLTRKAPRTALSHVRGYRARYRWSRRETFAALVGDRGLAESWKRLADALDGPRPMPRRPHLDWLLPLRAPAWAAPDLVATARRLFAEAAGDAEPFHDDRGQHGTLANLRAYSHSYRMMARTFRSGGLALRLPYLDDRVAEAVLAVRLSERTTPWRYKPLLVEAMRGVVPDAVLARRTKGEFSVDAHSGLRDHLPGIMDLFADSMLAERGLIDVGVLRTRLLGAHRDNHGLLALDATLSTELWLRAVSGLVTT